MPFETEQQLAIIKAVSNAPSVHNVQPARFHFKGDNIYLIEDVSRRIPFGDPSARDINISLGIAAEGLAIELSKHGCRLIDKGESNQDFGFGANLQTRRIFEVQNGAQQDNLAHFVEFRYSHRGNFIKPTMSDIATLSNMASEDKIIITDKNELKFIGKMYDDASLSFFRDENFRAEILSWMRLSKSHPKWSVDGLNYEAMAMSGFEGAAAKFILGPRIFLLLDKIGLGGPITAEAEKIIGGAGILLLHRKKSETPFESGRYFYRTWLEIVEKGYQAAIMAALADDEYCQNELCKMYNIDDNRRIITSFRIGKANGQTKRARINPEDLILK